MGLIRNNQNKKMRGKKATTPELRIELNSTHLVVFFSPDTHKAFFDISDDSGNVLTTGTLNGLGSIHIPIAGFEKGYYKLSIVDGAALIKKGFEIAA